MTKFNEMQWKMNEKFILINDSFFYITFSISFQSILGIGVWKFSRVDQCEIMYMGKFEDKWWENSGIWYHFSSKKILEKKNKTPCMNFEHWTLNIEIWMWTVNSRKFLGE